MSDVAKELAIKWLKEWEKGTPENIPLAEDFVHRSPLMGTLEGRDHYIKVTKPMAAKNVSKIRILDVISEGDWAVVRYETEGPAGTLPACDWIRVKNGKIQEIQGFYDTAGLHKPG